MDDIISRKGTLAALHEIKEALACGGDPILAALMNTPIKRVEEQPTATPWVKVSDRLPEIGELVLVYTGDHMDVNYREGADCWGFEYEHEITHWAPMPEPPKEETT